MTSLPLRAPSAPPGRLAMRDVRQRVRGRAAVERVRAILDTAAGDELDELVTTLERLAERGAAA